jgi:hypothetical protein
MTPIMTLPPSNPFATRFVRPGAMPFLFPPAIDAAGLVARLRELDWRGAIVGPHGSGKSTLLETLRPELLRAGRRVVHFALHDGQRSLPPAPSGSQPWDCETIAIVDGYEQLGAWNRRRLERRCRRAGCGLLVTSHRPTRLPELYRTAVNCELLERIVERLVTDAGPLISADDVRRAFSVHGQNAREALFALYDLVAAGSHRV